MIYGHYTSASALLNILSSEVLWATNIKFLNDEQEFTHALHLVEDVIARAQKTTTINNKYFDEFISDVKKTLNDLDGPQSDNIFTCSFSEQRDLLSQWRGYCPENQGYCINFQIEKILENAKKKYIQCDLKKCIYDFKEKDELISNLMNSRWADYLKGKGSKERGETIRGLARDLRSLASHFKHPSFSEEKEHRIVIQTGWDLEENVRFRVGQLSIIPYLEIPIDKNSIEEIIIGPTRNQKLAKRGLSSLINAKFDFFDTKQPKIIESVIPYRQ